MGSIEKIHDILLGSFGPQHWWPVTEDGNFHPTYSNGPKNEKQQLEVCIGAILAQNTSWNNAEKAIIELNKSNMMDVKKINSINIKKLAKIIRSSGYHNQKARKLKNFCRFLLKNYHGSLSQTFQNDIVELRNQLLSVSGIGPETADSIILYAAKKPVFVVDAYAKRIMNRMGYKESGYDELQEIFMQSLLNNEKLFNECHALFVQLGKNICKKEPLCGKCPLNNICSYPK